LFGHFVVALLLPTGVHLRAREPCLGVHMERRERAGDRQGKRCQGAWRLLTSRAPAPMRIYLRSFAFRRPSRVRFSPLPEAGEEHLDRHGRVLGALSGWIFDLICRRCNRGGV